jgi:hypothetical protein
MLLEDSLLYQSTNFKKSETYHERKLAYPQPILLCRQQTSQSKRNLSVIIKIFLSGMGRKAMNNWMKEILHTPLTVLLLPSRNLSSDKFLSRNGWKTMNNNLNEENLHTPDSFIIAVNKLLKSQRTYHERKLTPDSFIIAVNKLLKSRETYHQYISVQRIWKAMNNNLDEKLA